MDDIDRASEREQELTREALSKRMAEGPKATGYCLQCGQPFVVRHYEVESGRRWCDSQCRDDWERAQTKG
jgi:RNA polymerase-binding transcription factor DksA